MFHIRTIDINDLKFREFSTLVSSTPISLNYRQRDIIEFDLAVMMMKIRMSL